MKSFLLLSLLAVSTVQVSVAQNPIIRDQFTADPTARVFGGKVWLYPSHDIPPSSNPSGRQDWFCMADYHVFSSDNLVDWTDHGVILDQRDVPWGDSTAFSMWAPDCIQGPDRRYYFYFPDAAKPDPATPDKPGGFRIGVATSFRPEGPFSPEPTYIEGIRGIDPCVLQASDGNNYIYWAGGAIFCAKLKSNLKELDSPVQRIEGLPKGFVEGPFVFEHNKKFYLTYPWVRKEGGTETLAYCMSDSPMGPWEFKGLIMKESPTGCWTNHHSIVNYQNQWYLFYHHNDLSPDFDKNRSVRIDSLFFNPDGTIQEVIPTEKGVGRVIKPVTRGGMATGIYRNMFREAGYKQADIDQKVQEAFDDVFTGPNKCYFEVGNDMAYISDVKNKDVRTEGMSYGLMIAVQFDRKDIFDKLWRWAKQYMQLKEGPMKGYFRWSCRIDGTSNAKGPASDGELYFITSLIFASNRWGNDTGIDYLAEAQAILDACQPRESNGRTLALIDPKTDLISFVPGIPFTDPSYHIPAFYEVWARYANDGRSAYWQECARKSREYLHKSINPQTGLNPDYNNFDGSLLNSKQVIGDAFRYDSWRVPMNIAMDYSWSCADAAWQQEYGHTIQNFFYSQGIDSYVDQFNVDGTMPEKILKAGNYPEKLRHSVGLVSTLAAASLLCTHSKSLEFIDRLWNSKNEPMEDGYIDVYYDALLRLFAFMHLSGRYQVIEKQMQFSSYFEPVADKAKATTPDAEGFIRRWKLQDPINMPGTNNPDFTDSYLRKVFSADYSAKTKGLEWLHLDSKLWNIKLFRFSTGRGLQKYQVLFWGETTIECDQEITDIRLAAGSNSASMWWLNGEEILLLSGDRRMVQDDGVSKTVKLRKGKNTLRCAVLNGPGMSDFCARFLDTKGNPITSLSIK